MRRAAGLAAGLPADLAVSAGGALDAARQNTLDVRLVAAVSAHRIVGELRPRPLFSSRNILTTSIGFTYHWSARDQGRSP